MADGAIRRWAHRIATLRRLGRLDDAELQAITSLASWVANEHTTPLRSATIHPSAWISPLASLRFTDKVEIGAHATVGPFCAVWGGYDVWTRVGASALLAPGVVIVAGGHSTEGVGPIREGGYDERDAIVGEGAWIGAHATIVGCRVGDGAVIGTGSVVLTDIPDRAIAVGAPARVVRYRDADDAPVP